MLQVGVAGDVPARVCFPQLVLVTLPSSGCEVKACRTHVIVVLREGLYIHDYMYQEILIITQIFMAIQICSTQDFLFPVFSTISSIECSVFNFIFE